MKHERPTILVTGAGSPGIGGTLHSLRDNYQHKELRIVCTDVHSEVPGKFLCDIFEIIPPATNSGEYLNAIQELRKKYDIQAILPQNTAELEILSSHRQEFLDEGCTVLVSPPEGLGIANNKALLMDLCRKNAVPCGEFITVNNFTDLEKAARSLGWPDVPVVVKPPVSNGMRGLRIIQEHHDRKAAFFNEKPDSAIISMDLLHETLGEEFPELLVTEHLPGKEYSVDCLRIPNCTLAIPRSRDMIRSGITFRSTLVNDKKLIDYSLLLSNLMGLEYCFGFQFREDKNGIPKILECNPRVQGTMVHSSLAGANIIYLALASALNEKIIVPNINWDVKFYRYWGGISNNPGNGSVVI
jgi:carbamoyl-phosphate synthase large subunit